MFKLKTYQNAVTDSLRGYFSLCNQLKDADTAFYEASKKIWGRGIPYHPVKELPGLPYVCVRVPTGGGKTIIACHSLSIAKDSFLHADNALVLWLVPSNAIKEQTIKALKNQQHPYRKALDATLGSVEIFNISEALSLKPSVIHTATAVIVSTIQAFRVEDTEGRKVYETNGSLMEHFSRIPEQTLQKMERYEDGKAKPTLANVLCLYRPIVIVDEAHNARTGLSFETLKRFNPSCIMEFTATPDTEGENASNVLHSVSAAELYAENMIKMPIQLETRSNWKELLTDAIRCLNNLDELAKQEYYETDEYIRPIMLIQAQPQSKVKETLTYETVRQCLLEDFRIKEEETAVSTGGINELEDLNLSDKNCKIRFIITVQKLREGWDCPFAYVLCTLAEMKSATAIEQITGRILRLPNAERKQQKELNCAYAFCLGTESKFPQILNSLSYALIQNGFEKQEAKDFIKYTPPQQKELDTDEADLFNCTVTVHVDESPALENLSVSVSAKIAFDSKKSTLTFKGKMSPEEKEEIKKCFSEEKNKTAIEMAFKKSNRVPEADLRTPSEKGEDFSIPVLAFRQGNFLEKFEEQHFLEYEWELAKCDFTLQEYTGQGSAGRQGQIFVDEKGKIRTEVYTDQLQNEMNFLFPQSNWTVAHLVNWLDRKLIHPDISQEDMGIFLTRMLVHLVGDRKMDFEKLVYDKYNLLTKIEKKIDLHRENAHRKSYTGLLFGESSPVTVSPEKCFSYTPDPFLYPYSAPYTGSYAFRKHYYPRVGDLKNSGEEFECAQFIDSTLSRVKFWVRNPERKPQHSFWLQTATDKFYPDFVCKLKDERFLVVEYKGEDRWSGDDAKEKRNLGELWAERSGGQCLFVMPKGKDFEMIAKKCL